MNSTEPLLDRTYKLLEATNLTYEEIATGAGVKFDWLAKFKQRHITEPGVSKVQAVHDFLADAKQLP
jgi:transcriptional regulator with XRE-family HTH domain